MQPEEPEEDKLSKTLEGSKIMTRSMAKARDIEVKSDEDVGKIALPAEEGTLDQNLPKERD